MKKKIGSHKKRYDLTKSSSASGSSSSPKNRKKSKRKKSNASSGQDQFTEYLKKFDRNPDLLRKRSINEVSVGGMIDILNLRRKHLKKGTTHTMNYLPNDDTKIQPKTLLKLGSKVLKRKIDLSKVIDNFYKIYDREKDLEKKIRRKAKKEILSNMNQIKNKITAEKFMKGSISKKRGRGPGFAFEGKMKNDGTTLVSTGHNVGLGYQQAGDQYSQYRAAKSMEYKSQF